MDIDSVELGLPVAVPTRQPLLSQLVLRRASSPFTVGEK